MFDISLKYKTATLHYKSKCLVKPRNLVSLPQPNKKIYLPTYLDKDFDRLIILFSAYEKTEDTREVRMRIYNLVLFED